MLYLEDDRLCFMEETPEGAELLISLGAMVGIAKDLTRLPRSAWGSTYNKQYSRGVKLK
jgi:hypothetical protein